MVGAIINITLEKIFCMELYLNFSGYRKRSVENIGANAEQLDDVDNHQVLRDKRNNEAQHQISASCRVRFITNSLTKVKLHN